MKRYIICLPYFVVVVSFCCIIILVVYENAIVHAQQHERSTNNHRRRSRLKGQYQITRNMLKQQTQDTEDDREGNITNISVRNNDNIRILASDNFTWIGNVNSYSEDNRDSIPTVEAGNNGSDASKQTMDDPSPFAWIPLLEEYREFTDQASPTPSLAVTMSASPSLTSVETLVTTPTPSSITISPFQTSLPPTTAEPSSANLPFISDGDTSITSTTEPTMMPISAIGSTPTISPSLSMSPSPSSSLNPISTSSPSPSSSFNNGDFGTGIKFLEPFVNQIFGEDGQEVPTNNYQNGNVSIPLDNNIVFGKNDLPPVTTKNNNADNDVAYGEEGSPEKTRESKIGDKSDISYLESGIDTSNIIATASNLLSTLAHNNDMDISSAFEGFLSNTNNDFDVSSIVDGLKLISATARNRKGMMILGRGGLLPLGCRTRQRRMQRSRKGGRRESFLGGGLFSPIKSKKAKKSDKKSRRDCILILPIPIPIVISSPVTDPPTDPPTSSNSDFNMLSPTDGIMENDVQEKLSPRKNIRSNKPSTNKSYLQNNYNNNKVKSKAEVNVTSATTNNLLVNTTSTNNNSNEKGYFLRSKAKAKVIDKNTNEKKVENIVLRLSQSKLFHNEDDNNDERRYLQSVASNAQSSFTSTGTIPTSLHATNDFLNYNSELTPMVRFPITLEDEDQTAEIMETKIYNHELTPMITFPINEGTEANKAIEGATPNTQSSKEYQANKGLVLSPSEGDSTESLSLFSEKNSSSYDEIISFRSGELHRVS